MSQSGSILVLVRCTGTYRVAMYWLWDHLQKVIDHGEGEEDIPQGRIATGCAHENKGAAARRGQGSQKNPASNRSVGRKRNPVTWRRRHKASGWVPAVVSLLARITFRDNAYVVGPLGNLSFPRVGNERDRSEQQAANHLCDHHYSAEPDHGSRLAFALLVTLSEENVAVESR